MLNASSPSCRTVPAFVCAAALVALGMADPARSRLSQAELKLRLRPVSTVYTLYEPIVIAYTLTNPTALEVESGLAMPYGRGVGLSIQGELGEAKPYTGGPAICWIPTANRHFRPGETDTGEVVMFFNESSDDLAFPTPGRYRIQGTAHVWNDPNPVLIKTDPVMIEVRDPTDLDRKAIEVLGGRDNLVALFRTGVKGLCGDDSEGKCSDSLRSLLRRFPESAYAPAVTYYYGEAVAAGTISVGPNDELAIDLLNGFLRRWPGHPFEPSVTAALIRELHRTGRRQDSLEWLHRFEQKFPERQSQLRELRTTIE